MSESERGHIGMVDAKKTRIDLRRLDALCSILQEGRGGVTQPAWMDIVDNVKTTISKLHKHCE